MPDDAAKISMRKCVATSVLMHVVFGLPCALAGHPILVLCVWLPFLVLVGYFYADSLLRQSVAPEPVADPNSSPPLPLEHNAYRVLIVLLALCCFGLGALILAMFIITFNQIRALKNEKSQPHLPTCAAFVLSLLMAFSPDWGLTAWIVSLGLLVFGNYAFSSWFGWMKAAGRLELPKSHKFQFSLVTLLTAMLLAGLWMAVLSRLLRA